MAKGKLSGASEVLGGVRQFGVRRNLVLPHKQHDGLLLVVLLGMVLFALLVAACSSMFTCMLEVACTFCCTTGLASLPLWLRGRHVQ